MFSRYNVDLRELIKRNKNLYSLYYFFASSIIHIMRLFIRPDSNLILFVSFGGRYYNDSPRTLYQAMLNDPRFKDFKLVWALRDPQTAATILPNVIKIDTLRYFLTALRARCWITNVQIERGLSFKGKNTFYFHTTHVTLPKLSGFHVVSDEVFHTKSTKTYDYSIAQSEYEAKLQESMFNLSPQQIAITGLPKNDILINQAPSDSHKIRKKLGIPKNKKIILYAPTYREEEPTKMKSIINLDLWHEILGKEYIILFRVHPTVINETNLDKYSKFVIDVSNYPENSDLMLAADILISDYSGIFFEFGVQMKPMYCFAYDYAKYVAKRPLYFDIREKLPGGNMNERQLLEKIRVGYNEDDWATLNDFQQKYLSLEGRATERCIDIISKNIL